MIRVNNLVKRFGEFTAVDDISFEVGTGEIFAFLGPNGAGKTTTIKILTTLLQPTSGSFEVDGLDPAKHAHEVRRRFGIVFQDPSLDQDLTAWENMEIHGVLYGVARKERHAALESPKHRSGQRELRVELPTTKHTAGEPVLITVIRQLINKVTCDAVRTIKTRSRTIGRAIVRVLRHSDLT